VHRIIARDIRVFAYHGVSPQEKREGQEFLIDIEIELPAGAEADDDDLSSTVDYAVVVDEVASLSTRERYDLIETLASRIVDYLLSLPGVARASATVKKPRAPLAVTVGWVGVTVTGEREGRPGGTGGVSTAYLGLGSNQGDRLAFLRAAVSGLAGEDGVTVVATSSVYRSEPVGFTGQLEFLNAVVVVDTSLSPRDLLELVQRIEDSNGRRRRRRWGPRTLDVDILLIDGVEVDETGLTVPHPRLTERRFVLEPMLEVAPDASLPDGTPLREVRDGIGNGHAVRMEGGL